MQPPDRQWKPLGYPEMPLQNIGLAFSGGGFRAASYGLGVLSYLNSVLWDEETGQTLLHNVTYTASASGGTIPTAMYALNCAEGKSFGEFYTSLYKNLDGLCLLNEVFRILNIDDEWKSCPHKRRNLINAFSLAYDNLLFNHKTGSVLQQAVSASPLEEVCFNTTDFYRGLLFRQSIKMKPDKPEPGFLYGNFMLNLSHQMAGNLKLADMLAASSCFPAGFEPIVFPSDFVNEHAGRKDILQHLCVTPQQVSRDELLTTYTPPEMRKIIDSLPQPLPGVPHIAQELANAPEPKDLSTGFMDGGVTDNQGIESLMTANDRREKKETTFKPFDFMMVNDVGSAFMDPYKPEKETSSYTGLAGITVNTILILSAVIALVGLALLLYAFFFASGVLTGKICTAIGVVLLIAGVIVFGGIELFKRFIRGRLYNGSGLNLDKNFSRSTVTQLFKHFGHTPVAVILVMLKERFNSILTLNNDVFLKRIRKLLYQRFFDDAKRKFRIKTNNIYDLAFANDLDREKYDPTCLAPSLDMQWVAQQAFEMATTLWFDTGEQTEDVRAALIACGQFTTCYNLLVYIRRVKQPGEDGISYFDTLSPAAKAKINWLDEHLYRDYEAFRSNPYRLYNELGKEFHIKDFSKGHIHKDSLPPSFRGLRKFPPAPAPPRPGVTS